MLHAIVHSAGIQDRDGGIALLATLFGQFPFLEKLFADSAYQGPIFGNALAKILPCLETEIVKRSDQAKGFVQLPKRWIVERTIAWLNRCRRLAKDWENLNRNALAFLKLASIRLMLRKLCCVLCQAGCHGFLSLSMALRMVRSLRATAMRATIFGFPSSEQAFIEGPEDRIVSGGGERGHEERRADRAGRRRSCSCPSIVRTGA